MWVTIQNEVAEEILVGDEHFIEHSQLFINEL
jgi:hypothetical protein